MVQGLNSLHRPSCCAPLRHRCRTSQQRRYNTVWPGRATPKPQRRRRRDNTSTRGAQARRLTRRKTAPLRAVLACQSYGDAQPGTEGDMANRGTIQVRRAKHRNAPCTASTAINCARRAMQREEEARRAHLYKYIKIENTRGTPLRSAGCSGAAGVVK